MKALSSRLSTDASTFDEENRMQSAPQPLFVAGFRDRFHLQHWRACISFSEFEFNRARAELSGGDVEAHCDFRSDRHLRPAGSDILEGRVVMLRKTVIALLAVASVGLVSPTMALARGGGGGGHGGGFGGGMGGGFHGGGFGGGGFHGGGFGGYRGGRFAGGFHDGGGFRSGFRGRGYYGRYRGYGYYPYGYYDDYAYDYPYSYYPYGYYSYYPSNYYGYY
jgi:hypothetical protein